MAFEKAGGRCVFSSELNEHSRNTYESNFGDVPSGDIRQIRPSEIPDHDVLVAGFPCQPFSLAGVSKKRSMNRPDGFADSSQGDLFFEIVRILRAKRPRAFLLENVKNLRSHDGGRTLMIIEKELKKLGYDIRHEVIDARSAVPQHRERLFLVGFAEPTNFAFPQFSGSGPKLKKILDSSPDAKYTLTDGVWSALKRHAERNRKKGNGFGYGLADLDGASRTLSARYYKDGAEILVYQGSRKNPRRLTPKECALLMGFPKNFKLHVSDSHAYRQLGNAVVPPIVSEIAKHMVPHITAHRMIVRHPRRKTLRAQSTR